MLMLEAKTSNEKLILKYLEENASDVLREKINSGNKTLKDCWEYIRSEARKKAVNGCACIDDATVFGWAIHFFEEDGIKPAKTRAPSPDRGEPCEEIPKKETKKEKKKPVSNDSQLSFEF